MFQIGQMIMYGRSGVCEVLGVAPLAGISSDALYYTLKPVFGTETIYAPVEGKVFMRPVISAEEANGLLAQTTTLQENICAERNLGILREHYESALNSRDNLELLRLIKSVYQKSKQAVAAGRKPGQLDQQYKKRAEDLLYGELAVVLQLPKDEVESEITRRVETEDAE